MLILGIESSCDETAVAIVENGTRVLSNTVASLQSDFAMKGGVIPEDAARKQLECILPVLHTALRDAGYAQNEIDTIAVTRGPGLLGSLLIGTTTARLLSSLWETPLIGVHHTLGHLSSIWLDIADEPEFPIITLSASGGHTDLWYRTSHLTGELIGTTRDDAAGEAFDKGASMLGLPYPGGPSIAKAALEGKEDAYEFPRPLHEERTCALSFSGLKTALKYTIADLSVPLETARADLAASFQFALCRHLTDRMRIACENYPDCREIHIVGGVSANTRLREMLTALPQGILVRHPVSLRYCTDNAAMIAAAGYFLLQEKKQDAYLEFDTQASLPLTAVTLKR